MTVAFAGGQWLVRPGYHGRPRRRYRARAEDILDEQRHIRAAEVADTLAGWLALAKRSWSAGQR